MCQGEKRGENIVFLFTMEDIRFCHLGDLGHILNEKQIQLLQSVDILFIPIGGTYTLDGKKAWDVIKKINPLIIIPMHYKIEGLSLPIAPLDDFISYANCDVLKVGNQIDIDSEDLPTSPEIWIFTL
jgi:L-ascorbate metabolism protein UlaG (beta-lactamase superfamily)